MQLRPAVNKVKFDWHPWFRQCSQNAVKGGMIDAVDAIERYYKGQNRRPRFLGKSKERGFRADNGPGTVKLEEKVLTLPVKAGGPVKTKEALRWPDREIRSCRIHRKADSWYASVVVEVSQEEYGQTCGTGAVGIDLGLNTFATIAYPDDRIEKVDAPQPLKQSQRRMRRLQRKVSRRKKGSKNRRKAVMAVAKQHRRIENIRKDFLHKLTNGLTADHQVIRVESLSIKGWQRAFGRKTADLAPGEFLRQLAYKAELRGGVLEKANWHFPSSKLCHHCGGRYVELTLEERRWTCRQCGVIHDRDKNAALNLRDNGPELPGVRLWSPGKTSALEAKDVEAGTEMPNPARLG